MADVTWRMHATGPLTLHYQADSFAERNLELLADRFSKSLASIVALFGLKPDAMPPLDLYLAEFLPTDLETGVSEGAGASVRRDYANHTVWIVVNSEAPGDVAELEMAGFVLQQVYGSPPPASRIWFDGAAEYLAGRSGSSYHAEAPVRIRKLFEGGQLASLTDLLAGYTNHRTNSARATIGAFASFLVEEYGWDRFRRMLANVHADPIAGFARAYARPVQSLEQEWYRELIAASQTTGQSLFASIKELLPFISRYRALLAGIFLTVLMTISFAIFMPIAIRFLVGNILGNVRLPFSVPTIGHAGEVITPDERKNALVVMLVAMIVMFSLNSFASIRRTLMLATMGEGITYDLRVRFYNQLHGLPMSFHRRTPNSDLNTRFGTDIATVQGAITSGIVPLIQSLFTMLLFGIVLFSLNWKLSAVALVGLPIFAIVYQRMRKKTRDAIQERARRTGDVNNIFSENLLAQERIKLYGLRDYLTNRFSHRAQLARDLVIRISMLSSMTAQTGTLITNGAQVLILTVGGLLVLDHEITTGDLMAFYVLLLQLYAPAGTLTSAMTVLAQSGISLDRVKSILDMKTEADAADAMETAPLHDAIRIDNVTFGYQRGKELVKGLSVQIPAGSKVAFVGPPGAGKAALMDLLPRLYDPNSGSITWDGTDIKLLTRTSLRRELAVLSQELYVFNVTVYDNIRYGRVDATEEEIVAAAKTAGLHEFILSLPAGYDTQINDRDTSLTLAHRQRIAVARLLLQPASVILMDDALSAIDVQAQRHLENALRGPGASRTLIKIAQRVSSVADYDRIFVMDNGAIVEEGQHTELTDRRGLYTQLVKDELGEGAVSGAFAAVRRLAKQAPFSLLSPEILEEVARLMLYAERGPGDIICRQGTVGDELYFVGKGEVEVLIQHDDGHEQILGFINEGEYFGEISFLRRVPRTATCRAHDNVELHILRRQDFDQLLDRLGSDVTAHLDRTAQERLEATRAQLSAAESVGSAR